MASSPVFEWACAELEARTKMTRLQARGTLRLALGGTGLDVATLTARQLRVVASKLLVKELRARKIDDADGVCAALQDIPAAIEEASGAAHPSPEDVFKRLGR